MIKDYGSPHPVPRRRMFKRMVICMASGSAAIATFFVIIAAAITMLPAAIDAELQRQMAVVERNIEITHQ